MKTVKLTTSFNHTFLKDQINPQLLYNFEIDNDCTKCDYWVIWGDLPINYAKMSVSCPKEHIVYMTDEAFTEKKFDQNFLNQFDFVITCRDDLSHRHIIKTHEINTWHVEKSFLDVFNTQFLAKDKKISVVSSDLTVLPGHKKRYAFVNRLIGHFKDRLDVFGRGFNPVADKWDALAPYKYSIAIENSALPGYFTEKLTECYLAHTFPVYFGAPDITDYFDSASLLTINIEDYRTSIHLIEKLLEEDPWEKLQETLIQQKLLYLSRYQLFSALSTVLDRLPSNHSAKIISHTVKAHRVYEKYYKIKKMAKTAKKILGS
jgi:Glycosyltransferase family 10 (fucosyltransferase) C-term